MPNVSRHLLDEWQGKLDELDKFVDGRIRSAVLILSGTLAQSTHEKPSRVGRTHSTGLDELANELLRSALLAAASQTTRCCGWFNWGCRSSEVSGPFVKHFGQYDVVDLERWFDTLEALNLLMAKEPYASDFGTFLGRYEWLLTLFALGCSSQEVSFGVERYSFDCEGQWTGTDPLKGDGFQSFLNGQLMPPAGYHLCLLTGDVRQASQSAIRCLLRKWKAIASASDAEEDSTNGKPSAVARSPSGRVSLYGRGDRPIVNGKESGKLTSAQYDVVLALLKSGENGLTKDELEGNKTGRGGGRGVLYRLAKKPGWKAVIVLPGKTGRRYRIR